MGQIDFLTWYLIFSFWDPFPAVSTSDGTTGHGISSTPCFRHTVIGQDVVEAALESG